MPKIRKLKLSETPNLGPPRSLGCSQTLNSPGQTLIFLQPYPKIQNLAPNFSRPSPEVCCVPVRHKFKEEIDLLETSHFGPGPYPDLRPPPKNYLCGVRLVLKFSSRFFHSIKSYSTFYSGQTDTQTDSSPPIDKQTGKIFHVLFYTFHFITFVM